MSLFCVVDIGLDALSKDRELLEVRQRLLDKLDKMKWVIMAVEMNIRNIMIGL